MAPHQMKPRVDAPIVSFVFDLERPSADPMGALSRVVRSLFEHLTPPGATLSATPRWDTGTSGRKLWANTLRRDWKHALSDVWTWKRRVTKSTYRQAGDAIQTVPPDFDFVLIESAQRGEKRRTVGIHYSVSYHSIVQHLDALGGRLCLHVRADLLAQCAENVRPFVSDVVSIVCEESSVYGGLVDVAYASEIGGGLLYTHMMANPPLHRSWPEELYASEGANRNRFVRRTCWGNYLGPGLLKRFDSDGTFVNEFSGFRDYDEADAPTPKAGGSPDLPLTQFVLPTKGGGCFFAMSRSPLTWTDFDHGHGGMGFGEAWGLALRFHRRLRAKQLLL